MLELVELGLEDEDGLLELEGEEPEVLDGLEVLEGEELELVLEGVEGVLPRLKVLELEPSLEVESVLLELDGLEELELEHRSDTTVRAALACCAAGSSLPESVSAMLERASLRLVPLANMSRYRHSSKYF